MNGEPDGVTGALDRRATLGLLPRAVALGAGMGLLSQMLTTGAAAAAGDTSQVVKFDPRKALGAAGPMGPDWQVPGSPMPMGAGDLLYKSEDGKFIIMVFEAAPALVRLLPYKEDEFWLLLEGEVDFTNAAGETVVFGAGETFLVPKGFSGLSRIRTKMRKLAILYRS
ncbi:cupin domain-containing protein [Sphingobium sp. AN641]|uniref:cupin domain-containing protein n=1 Tax=Sphingobium sp. AN641 TaxID=3133443 RepID=UPI0030BE5A70